MFEVDACLTVPEITMKPGANEVYNILVHCVRDFLQRLRNFKRWMSETCLPCSPTVVSRNVDATSIENPEFLFTFYEDIIQVTFREY